MSDKTQAPTYGFLENNDGSATLFLVPIEGGAGLSVHIDAISLRGLAIGLCDMVLNHAAPETARALEKAVSALVAAHTANAAALASAAPDIHNVAAASNAVH